MNGHISNSRALRDALAYWNSFIAKCISQRLDTRLFDDYVRLVYSKYPLPPVAIADFFLRPQPSNDVSLDPRIPPYVQVLSRLGYIDATSILLALYKYSSLHDQVPKPPQEHDLAETTKPKRHPRWKSSSWAEEVMFYHVIKSTVEGTAFRDAGTALELLKIICKWMHLFTAASSALATDVLGELQNLQVRDEMEIARAAFVPLLLRLVDNQLVLKAIQKPFAKGVRKNLSQSLAGFAQTLQLIPQLVQRLEDFRTQTLARLDPVDKKNQAANAAMNELLDSAAGLDSFVVPEIPIANTRAGLYIYLNASLVGRPLIDDAALLTYLQNRYQGDAQTSAIDLILASFDILANAVFRKECEKDAHILRSFLINKLPLLLYHLCPPAFSPAAAEFCITTALNQVDTSVFPTASLMFDESRNNNPYTESVREEFCAACVLHGLVQREQLERILGESSMSFEPSLEKYSKEKLVQDCLSDPEKIQGLVRELDKTDGNVGAVCQALVELMRQLCNNKETMSLKLLCAQLAQKPQSLDILLLFEKLPNILEPLCTLLDNWRYEEDQGEYQPVYEEFGAILLLVLAFTYRYNLSPADIGIQSADSCIAKILGQAHISRQIENLTEQENAHIGGWIRGLFDSDTGGLGDDLMSSCPPQDFYLLIATIFQNIVVAYTHQYLTDESLKGGVEYLVDTFLLPSLVPAIRFLSDYLWVEQKEQKSIIKILQLILLPTSISGEASAMLSSVKNIIAQPLEHALRAYQREDPKNQDIEPLLRALKDSLPQSRRTGGADHNELEPWARSSSTGLAGAIKHTVQGLVQWAMHPGINMMPTSYTHRQLMAALNLVGPVRVLGVIVDEIRQQTETGGAPTAYDVATALVCAPNVMNGSMGIGNAVGSGGNGSDALQRPLTLRDVLKSQAEDCRKLHKTDPALAETVVRLYRRVEAQALMPPPQTMLEAPGMSLDLTGDAGGLGDALAATAGVQGDGMSVDDLGLDMGLGSDLGLGGTSGPGGGLDATGDGDLFGGLDTSMDVFDGWDSMELGGD